LLLLQSFFSEIVNGLQSANIAACSSSTDAPNIPNGVVQLLELLPCNVIVSGCILTSSREIVPAKTPAVELLSERLNQLSVKKETDLVGFLMFSLSDMKPFFLTLFPYLYSTKCRVSL